MGRKIFLIVAAVLLTFSLISFSALAVPAAPDNECWKTNSCPTDPDQPADKSPIQKPVPRLYSQGSPALPIDGSKGIQKILVIPVNFSDIEPWSTVDDLKVELEGLVDYYREVSYGNLELEIVFASADWVDLGNTMAYYGEDTEDEIDPYVNLLFEDAITAVDADVNFLEYDHVMVLHADRDQAAIPSCTDCIWSVRMGFGEPIITDEGAEINGVFTVAEIKKYFDPKFSLGTAAHELAHDIISPLTGRGAYDLYNVLTGESVVGKWSLMDSGSWLNPPVHLDPMHKRLYEWTKDAEMQVQQGESGLFTLKPSADDPNFFTVIVSNTEAFLVENRAAKGSDAAIPEEGIVIWHFDTINLFVGSLFNALDPPGLVLETLSTLDSAAFVDGEVFETSLSDLNDGNKTGLVIDKITRTGEEFSFRVNNNDTTPPELKIVLPSAVETTKDVLIVLDSPDAVSCTYSRGGLDPVGLEWDGKSWTGIDTPGDGTFAYFFKCNDAAVNTASASMDVLVDSTPPKINVLLPEPLTTSKDIIINLATDADVLSCTYSRAGADTVELTEIGGVWKGTDSLAEGKTDLTFKCTDKAGNSALTTFTVTVDIKPPSITVLSPTATTDKDTILETDDVSVEIKADDDTTFCSYSRSGMEGAVELIKEGDVWKASDTLPEGVNSFVFACTDAAGQTAFTLNPHTVLVDLSAPTVKTKYIEDGTVFAGYDQQLLKSFDITVSDVCLDVNYAGLKLDGEDLKPAEAGVASIAFPGPPIEGLQCSSGLSNLYLLNLSEYSEGSHTLEFRATDILGRETVETFEVEFAQRSPVLSAKLAEGQEDRIEFGELFNLAADFKIDDMLVYPTAKTIGSFFESLTVRLVPQVGLFGSGPVLCKEYNEPDTAEISETIECSATGLGGPQIIVVEGFDTHSNFILQGFQGPTVYNAEPFVYGSAQIEDKEYTLKEGDFVFDAIGGDYSTGILHASDDFEGAGAKLWTMDFTVSPLVGPPAPAPAAGGGGGGGGVGPKLITVYITNPGAVPVLDGKAEGFTGKFKILWDGKEVSSEEKGDVNVTWAGTGCKNNVLCSVDEMNENIREEIEAGNKPLPPWTVIIEAELAEGSVIPVTVLYETPTIHIERAVEKTDTKVSYLMNATASSQFYSENSQYLVFPLIQNISYKLPDGSERVEELSGNYSLLDSEGEEVSGTPASFCKTVAKEREYKVCYGGIKYLLTGKGKTWLSGDSVSLNFTADTVLSKPPAELEAKTSGGAGANIYKRTAFLSVKSDYTIENELLPGFASASDKKVFVDGKELSPAEWKEGSVIILGLEPGPHEIEVKYTVPAPQVSNPAPSGGGGGGGGFVTPPYSLTATASESNVVLKGEEAKTIEIEFENKGYEKLTGLSFAVEGLPAEWFSAESLPKEIRAGEKAKISIVFAPRGPSSELTGKVKVKAAEGVGAETEVKVSYTGSAQSPAPAETTTTLPAENKEEIPPTPVPKGPGGPTGLPFALDTGTALGAGIVVVVLAAAAYTMRGSKSWQKVVFRHKYSPRHRRL